VDPFDCSLLPFSTKFHLTSPKGVSVTAPHILISNFADFRIAAALFCTEEAFDSP
jgi:hypothetical protein